MHTAAANTAANKATGADTATHAYPDAATASDTDTDAHAHTDTDAITLIARLPLGNVHFLLV